MPKKPTLTLTLKKKPVLTLTKLPPAPAQAPFPNPANELKVRGLAGTPQSRALMA